MKKLILRIAYLNFSFSQTTSFNHEDLTNKILFQLNLKDYIIISNTYERILFSAYESKTVVVSVNRYSSKVPMGIFELYDTESGSAIKLTYHVTVVSEILMMICLVVASFFVGYSILLIGFVLLFRVFVKVSNLKRVGKNLIYNILSN